MHCTERQTLNLSVMPFGNTFHGKNTYAHIFTCLPSSPSNYLIAEGWTRCYAHIVLKTCRCAYCYINIWRQAWQTRYTDKASQAQHFAHNEKLVSVCEMLEQLQNESSRLLHRVCFEATNLYICILVRKPIDDLKHLLYNCSCRFRNSLDDPCEGLTSLNCYNCPPLPTRDY